MDINNINSLEELKLLLKKDTKTFLLLYKKGSEQSECALKNLSKQDIEGVKIIVADVSTVRDIHPAYNIKSAPSFLEFIGDTLTNIYKGCHETEFYNNLIVGSVYSASNSGEEKPQKRVTVYSTPSCSWCTRLKTYLDSKGIKYRDVDVSKDPKAAEDLVKRSGQQGVPQTDINGTMIVGFDQNKIDTLLGI
ncbi:MAG: glutaredoxin domain-containing protein [Bacteroidota bacterium]